jgi:NTE family protein
MDTANSKATKETPLQLVFQGGGARLCALMAVCEYLQKSDKIKLTRVAGSSAGAIAAAMLASKLPISEYKLKLQAIGNALRPNLNVCRYFGALRVAQGGRYFKSISLENIFNDLFCKDTNLKLVGDLPIDAELYFTDLYTLRSRSSEKSESLPKALAKSCRFPFAFVGYSDGVTEVDGGLALNLPVDHLKADESQRGSVIGVSFAESIPHEGQSSLLSYTQQLFSAAIQSGVNRSEFILGKQNVFYAETTINTFDFEDALDYGLGAGFRDVKSQFKKWLDIWLKTIWSCRAQAARIWLPTCSAATVECAAGSRARSRIG